MTEETLEVQVGRLLTQHHLTVVTAESCTGGLIGHLLTNVSGSSTYVLGGVIAYSNEAKVALLGVSPATLEADGAVSEASALAMARGVRERFGADIAVSSTGIAGPTGGTADKPVGLVYIGLASARGEQCERHVWSEDRMGNKFLSAQAALRLLLTHLEGLR